MAVMTAMAVMAPHVTRGRAPALPRVRKRPLQVHAVDAAEKHLQLPAKVWILLMLWRYCTLHALHMSSGSR